MTNDDTLRTALEAMAAWTRHRTILPQEIRTLLAAHPAPECECVTSGPGLDGPSETCPQHGRPYSEWVERGDILQARLDAPPAPVSATRREDERLGAKYRVERTSDPTGKHEECGYFVLDPRHDPHAVTAIRAYSAAVRSERPGLADDLDAWVGAPVSDTRREDVARAINRSRTDHCDACAEGVCPSCWRTALGQADAVLAVSDIRREDVAREMEYTPTTQQVRILYGRRTEMRDGRLVLLDATPEQNRLFYRFLAAYEAEVRERIATVSDIRREDVGVEAIARVLHSRDVTEDDLPEGSWQNAAVRYRYRSMAEAVLAVLPAPPVVDEAEVRERIAQDIEAVDPVEWALAGQHAGEGAARIARGATR